MGLAVELNELSVARTHPNPYFEQFANAIARRRGQDGTIALTRQEIDAQAKLADEVLDEILSEKKSSDADGAS